MRRKNATKRYLAALACAGVLGVGAESQAAVSVYAEGAYTATDLVVNIYADITGEPLVSTGVKLMFDPSRLTVAANGATKNEGVWYFGDASAKIPYMAPEVNPTTGEVVIITGKLDTSAPTDGVLGNRVPVGQVKFTRADNASPGATPELFFGVSLENGKADPYVNFATTASVSLDPSVTYTAKIRKRGDANADGAVNAQDMSAVKNYMTAGGTANIWKDCNADGNINAQDMSCVKYSMTH